MTLSNADGASGVGVRVLDSDTNASIPLGQNVPINKYQPNQDNQAIDLKFGAIYYQTEDKIKGGEADAQATLTLSYE
ncbi:hypothetical protein WS48_17510 [Burkholderia sp. RF7-non_BP1]|nr:hypothetical protein WS45_28260 [Burkholderia sp. RF2-non_BP3]KUY82000.1 hypothetical protein WS46_15775 [Burkholderia sp. RF4-BP95]KUY95626.1 hypothetical protein WS48_17510 [Burkholderia sp. RF7-non_BP1]KUY98929.1 hypothetical protein WS49_19005 [Burkholderia sp. RF7-non_BP4]